MDNIIEDIRDLNAQKGFKLAHLNIRSLFKKMDQLRILLDNSNVDVFTISETWLNPSIFSSSLNLRGYVQYRQDRGQGSNLKKRGGGLLTYIRNDHSANCEIMPDLYKVSADFEAQWTLIHRAHCREVVVCNVYRTPSGNVNKFFKYFEECTKQLRLDKIDLFILGDMNINYKNKVSGEFKKLKFFMQANGLSQLVTNATRNSDKSKSLIDLILTNSKHISSAGTLSHFVSDHQPIFAVKKKKRDTREKEEFIGRSYKHYNKQEFRDKLNAQNWDEFYNISDPDSAWDYILNQITPILDKMCPLRSFSIKNYRPAWVTDELIEQIKDRDYFYKKAKTSK